MPSLVEINEIVIDDTGRPISGATVQVNVRGAGAATIYNSGGAAITNPVVSSGGNIDAWVYPGSYDLVVTVGGRTYTHAYEAVSGTEVSFGGDTNLYRSAANTLKTDDTFVVAGSLNHEGTFFNMATAGTITFGADTNLYRAAADTLKTDDSLHVAQQLIRPVVSTLPASPVDGMEVLYQTSAMATDGIVWHLRYRSGSASTYKWEFLGGASLEAQINTIEANNGNGVYGDAATVGPSVAVPLAGVYDYEFTAKFYGDSGAADFRVAPSFGGSGGIDTDSASYSTGTNSSHGVQLGRTIRRTRSAAETVTLKYYRFGTANNTVAYRNLSVRPVRVG